MKKQYIKDLTVEETEVLIKEMGLEKYRARQLYTWMYAKNVASFDEMTNFSKLLREKVSEKFELNSLTLKERRISKIDMSEKYLFETFDGHYIESVLIKNKQDDEGRITICISSQVGCPMGCVFCNTAKIGFKRNLSPAEIIDQICFVRRISGLENNNIVFMGMGEPFLNYESVMKAAMIFNYTFGFHISVRKITISTCGILPGIERFIDEEQPYNLAVSLNDTVSERRASYMPVENKYPIKDIAELLQYRKPISHNRMTMEYVMRKDNITVDDAKRLKKMFNFKNIKLNLIPLNAIDDSGNTPSDKDVLEFLNALERLNIISTVRKSLGSDIGGACGQLSGKYYDEGLS